MKLTNIIWFPIKTSCCNSKYMIQASLTSSLDQLLLQLQWQLVTVRITHCIQ